MDDNTIYFINEKLFDIKTNYRKVLKYARNILDNNKYNKLEDIIYTELFGYSKITCDVYHINKFKNNINYIKVITIIPSFKLIRYLNNGTLYDVIKDKIINIRVPTSIEYYYKYYIIYYIYEFYKDSNLFINYINNLKGRVLK